MRSSRSPPERGCSSPIRIRRGRDRQTRTRTGYCASTSRRAPTCPGGRPRILKPSPSRSTTGPARSSAGRLPPKSSTSSYAHFNHPVLHRPVELAQYTSVRLAETLHLAGLTGSVGTVGDAYDNALAETTIGLYKCECVRDGSPFRDGPLRTLADVEKITSQWVHWYNTERLMHRLGGRPPAEAEAAYWAARQ